MPERPLLPSGTTVSSTRQKNWTILELIKWSAGYLAERGIETARLDAELLLAFVLEIDRTRLYMNFDQPLNEGELSAYRNLLKRRGKREPLQYITGRQEFWSMQFRVNPTVLIPRPETELLVEEGTAALKRSFPGDSCEILDIGAGSGAIAAALAAEVKGAGVTGVELSPEAAALARENIESNDLSKTVTILEGNLFEPVEGRRFHLIVSNPPYIPQGDLETLQPEVRLFEPPSALDGGIDGLDFYRRIIPEATRHLCPGGWLIVEHGMGQSAEIFEIFRSTGSFVELTSVKDLSGIERVVRGQIKIGQT